jgi:hypothetical protein
MNTFPEARTVTSLPPTVGEGSAKAVAGGSAVGPGSGVASSTISVAVGLGTGVEAVEGSFDAGAKPGSAHAIVVKVSANPTAAAAFQPRLDPVRMRVSSSAGRAGKSAPARRRSA